MNEIRAAQRDFGLLLRLLLLQGAFLAVLTAVRLVVFLRFAPAYPDFPLGDFLRALWMGLRIDLVLVAYLTVLPFLLILANALLWHPLPQRWLRGVLAIYFAVMYLLVLAVAGADLAFFSYFGEHINILFFGVFDDDTRALLAIARKNYNLFLIGGLVLLVTSGVIGMLRLAFGRDAWISREVRWWHGLLVYPLLVVAIFFAARGSLGTFPLIKDVPEVSPDRFLNGLPMNGVLALQKAWEQYAASKADRSDLAAKMGYRDAFPRAVADFLGRPLAPDADPEAALWRTAGTREAQSPPHVVVVMVESFGAPILKYQSAQFDILGRLARHFAEDILFRRFFSGGNGTITSLEPLLLNLLPRPASVPLSQSLYQRVAFPSAAARVFRQAGYETRFVYGGDLSWRNVGEFYRLQGFEHTEGKASILADVPGARSHDWGVFDQYAYRHVLRRLRQARRPQFIFLLTTNNHPPYTVPEDYQGPPLVMPAALKAHIRGDPALLAARLRDYQYALDSAGGFLDAIKASSLRERVVVALTGDNNTIEGVIRYDDPLKEAKRVPFYLYLPAALRPAHYDPAVAASHKDIFPTLYHRLPGQWRYLALGTDLFEPGTLHCGFNDAGVIQAPDGAFRLGRAASDLQRACERQYRSGLAVSEFLIRRARKEGG